MYRGGVSYLDATYFTDPAKAAALLDDTRLSADQLTVAAGANPSWQLQLADAWQGARISQHADHPSSAEFADDVRAWQLANTGREPDGVLDRRTNDAIRGVAFILPESRDYFVIDGQHIYAEGLRVVTPEEPGALVFTKGFWHDPLLAPTGFVNHWDGCMDAHSCFNVLVGRGLSVLFLIDCDGTVYMTGDPAQITCWHAGSVNRRTWGVEIANPVLPARNARCTPARPLSTMRVRGDTHPILGFYPAQTKAAVLLNQFVADYAGMPFALPAYKGKPGVVAASFFPPQGGHWDAGGHRGLMGHYNEDNDKVDPGLELWQPLIDAGAQIVEVAA